MSGPLAAAPFSAPDSDLLAWENLTERQRELLDLLDMLSDKDEAEVCADLRRRTAPVGCNPPTHVSSRR